jgi:hypothetical protein
MENHGIDKDAELLVERLIRVENALFLQKMRSKCFPCRDDGEIERLEALRAELRSRCEGISQQGDMIAS